MKFTVTREQLQEGLGAVAAAIPAKTTLPVLANVLPEERTPCFVASSSTFARTGSVVLAGIAAATAPNPSCSCSRVIVNFIRRAASSRLVGKESTAVLL